MEKTIKLKLELFKGFYNSHIEGAIDDQIDCDLSEIGKSYDEVEITYDFKALASDIFDFAKYEALSELDFLSDLEFSELYSPRFYNYSNDGIYFTCSIDRDSFKDWLIDLTSAGGEIWDYIADSIEQRHTSYSGFHSFHSNEPKEWIKDLLKLDLDNDKTVYKLGFIISEYIDESKKFDDINFDFESEYLYNGNYTGVYECYLIHEAQEEV